jgi:hypothetical protein
VRRSASSSPKLSQPIPPPTARAGGPRPRRDPVSGCSSDSSEMPAWRSIRTRRGRRNSPLRHNCDRSQPSSAASGGSSRQAKRLAAALQSGQSCSRHCRRNGASRVSLGIAAFPPERRSRARSSAIEPIGARVAPSALDGVRSRRMRRPPPPSLPSCARSLAGCGDTSKVPLRGIGPRPNCHRRCARRSRPSHVVDAAAGPRAPRRSGRGLRVQPFATGLEHPRWLLALPNGDVLVAETAAPPQPEGTRTRVSRPRS